MHTTYRFLSQGRTGFLSPSASITFKVGYAILNEFWARHPFSVIVWRNFLGSQRLHLQYRSVTRQPIADKYVLPNYHAVKKPDPLQGSWPSPSPVWNTNHARIRI